MHHHHGLGPDCIQGTDDDEENQCPEGYYWLPDICGCVQYNYDHTEDSTECDLDQWCVYNTDSSPDAPKCDCKVLEEMQKLL